MANFKVFSEVPSQLLTQVSQSNAASLLTTAQNLTAASLLSQVSNLTAASLLSQVSNLTAASLLSQVSNLTADSLLTELGDRAVVDASEAVTSAVTTFTGGNILTAISLSEVTFTVYNASSTAGAEAALYLSADGTNFSQDPTTATQTIAASAQYFFAPGHFVKYMRIMYAAQTAGITASLTIYTQAHV